MEFRATLGAKLFCIIFVFVGIAAIGFGCYHIVTVKETPLRFGAIIPLLVGVPFAGFGVLMLYFFAKPVVFDKTTGRFYKGKKPPDEMFKQFDPDAKNKAVELGRIHALQLIAEYCSGQKSSYYSYELNLVLEDGERVNVVDHGKLNKIREDANTLSNFLGKPVWNAT